MGFVKQNLRRLVLIQTSCSPACLRREFACGTRSLENETYGEELRSFLKVPLTLDGHGKGRHAHANN